MTRVRGRRYVPAHTELVAKFRARIASGGWKPGERLPTQVELAAEYGVSRSTLRNALSALEARKAGWSAAGEDHQPSRALRHCDEARAVRQGGGGGGGVDGCGGGVFVVASMAGELRVRPGERMAEELLPIYQERFGITIARASERLAVARGDGRGGGASRRGAGCAAAGDHAGHERRDGLPGGTADQPLRHRAGAVCDGGVLRGWSCWPQSRLLF